MEIKQYKYSAAQMLMGVAGLSFLEIAICTSIMSGKSDHVHWLAIGCVSLIIVGRLAYLCIMYYIPCMLEKTALELDDEKLQCFITGKLLFQIPPGTVYWKDIDDIEYVTSSAFGTSFGSSRMSIIKITMKDGSAAGISTKNISGNDKQIYETVMEYFKRSSR